MEAYTYSLFHKPTNRVYYGCRKSSAPDLFVTYFTSSRLVNRLLRDGRISDFIPKIRRWFNSYEAARLWETRLLSRVNAPKNPRFLNQAVSAPRVCSKDPVAEATRRLNIATGMKKRWKNPTYRSYFTSAPKTPKQLNLPFPSMGRQIPTRPIIRNSVVKWVKNHAVPAYVKCGWKRVWYSASELNTTVPASPTSLAAL